MDFKQKIATFSIEHYKLITVIMVLFTLLLGALIPLIKVDTDPENMLSADEPVRVFHNQTKKQFALNDIVVVGIVNDKDPNGVFNPSSLASVYELTEFAKTLRWPDKEDPNEQIGVIEVDLLAPSTVDHIGRGGPGTVKFEWLMKKPPDVRRMVYMVHKHADPDKDDDRWLYLPDLDLEKRIAAGDKRTSFVGSDFLYEDVSGRSL